MKLEGTHTYCDTVFTQKQREGEKRHYGEEDGEHSNESEAPAFDVGDIVTVVETISTPQQLQIVLGKVLHLEARTNYIRRVLLAYLKPVTEGEQGCAATFRLVVSCSLWKESYAAVLHPIDSRRVTFTY